jgi:hypothetical protein
LAFISPFVNPEYHVLLSALAMIAAWIIPGQLLRNKYKSEIAETKKRNGI